MWIKFCHLWYLYKVNKFETLSFLNENTFVISLLKLIFLRIHLTEDAKGCNKVNKSGYINFNIDNFDNGWQQWMLLKEHIKNEET